MKVLSPLAAVAAFVLAPSLAEASCPARVGVVYGDTTASIAQRCGVNAEALRQANPGLGYGTLRPGTFVSVPRSALRSQQSGVGRPMVRVAPPLVQSPVGGGRPTVILPPEQPPIPPQHILRDFGHEPGQPFPPFGNPIRVP